MKQYILLAIAQFLIASAFSQMIVDKEVPIELSQGHVKQITTFGERCDWSHDGKHLIFLEKSFGDVYEVEVATGKLRPLTHHYFHQGYLRALYLANGDYLLVGARKFDPQNAWESRNPKNAEMWILKKDLQSPPTPLGVFCKEGPTCSRKQMKIAWTINDIFMAEVVYENGSPKLSNIDTLVRSTDLPGEVHNWKLETQNFRPP